jgi:hypothetical protein
MVAEKPAKASTVLACLVLVGAVGLGGCGEGSGSPRRFGPALVPPLSMYVGQPDLDAQLGAVEAETQALGLSLAKELRGELPRAAGPVVVRAYVGRDALGRERHAVRVATSRGVVMAVGPLAPTDPRDRATELVTALVPGPLGDEASGAYQSGTDLNGDGSPDVVVRNERGVMEVWGILATGATLYTIVLEVPATRALDVDNDGQVDFVGEVEVAPDDPIAPRLEDAATFQGAMYSNRTAAAKAWHARRADALAAATPNSTGTGAGTGAATGTGTATGTGAGAGAGAAPPVSDAMRLRRALELAWHRILSGAPRKAALENLDKEPIPADLREPFQRYRRIISRIAGAPPPASK